MAKKTVRQKAQGAKKSLVTKDNIIKAGVAAAVGYLVYKQVAPKANAGVAQPGIISSIFNPGSLTPGPNTTVNAPSANSANGFPLAIGSSGEVVKTLQRALLAMGGTGASYIRSTSMRSNGDVDGIFGSGTKLAVVGSGFSYPVSYNELQKII